MKRLTIVGRGTAGCVAAAHFLNYTNWFVDFYYDNSIKPQAVGEGSNLILPMRLNHTINFYHEDLPHVDGSFKYGIKKPTGLPVSRLHTIFRRPMWDITSMQ